MSHKIDSSLITDSKVSGEHIFRERQDGTLEFVGDFDGLYGSNSDPWGQLGTDERLAAYYAASRSNLVHLLTLRPAVRSILEVGCGFGQVCRQLQSALPEVTIAGSDISGRAISMARNAHPEITFLQGDVTQRDFFKVAGCYDAVILNQLLWYLLGNLPDVLNNMAHMIVPGGVLIVCNAFMRTPQRYGREVIDGFDGLVRYMATHTDCRFRFTDAVLNRDPALLYDDGVVVMERSSDTTNMVTIK